MQRSNDNKVLSSAAYPAVAALLIIFGISVLYYITKAGRTPFETDLMSLLLTIGSGFFGWWISKYYSERSAHQNLQDYGVQVARGVMVLQSQIKQLSAWVGDRRASLPAVPNPDVVDGQFDHVQEMLRSFQKQTETTLNAIGAIITDELKRHEDIVNQIFQIREEEILRTSKIRQELDDAPHTASQTGQVLEAIRRIETIQKETDERVASLAQRSSLPILETRSREVEIRCPSCNSPNSTAMEGGAGQTRHLVCPHCGASFNVHSTGSGNVFTRLMSFGPVPTKSLQAPQNRWDEWRFDFNLPANSLLFDLIPQHDAKLHGGGSLRTVNSLMESLFQDPAITVGKSTRTAVRKFLQACYHGRMFQLLGADSSFSGPYTNLITRQSVICALSRYGGYKFGLCGAPVEALTSKSALEAAFGISLSDGELQECQSEAAKQYAIAASRPSAE